MHPKRFNKQTLLTAVHVPGDKPGSFIVIDSPVPQDSTSTHHSPVKISQFKLAQRMLVISFSLMLMTPLVFANPLKPGGSLTHNRTLDRNSLMHLGTHLSSEDKLNAIVGQSIFEKIWIPSPSATHASDGLGPLYNARACSHCHIRNGRGQVKIRSQADARPMSLIVRVGRQNAKIGAYSQGDPTYGEQIQNLAMTGYQAEASILVSFTDIDIELSDGESATLQKPQLQLDALKYGDLDKDTRLSLRLAPPLIGMGLIEAIAANDIESWADEHDQNKDGISGRANKIIDPKTQQLHLTRFNLKASSPTLEHQSLSAFKNDIGISSYLFKADYADCTTIQSKCQNAPGGSSVDKSEAEVNQVLADAMLRYLENLAVPGRRFKHAGNIEAGRLIFLQSGCTDCHRPSYVTGVHKNTALSEQTIYPYSDLLLHDMGEGLADEVSNGLASGSEWRTPPLWGIGLTKVVSGSQSYLHDGRARNLSEAILWHGGEAQASRDQFAKMPAADRKLLLTFVKSL